MKQNLFKKTGSKSTDSGQTAENNSGSNYKKETSSLTKIDMETVL